MNELKATRAQLTRPNVILDRVKVRVFFGFKPPEHNSTSSSAFGALSDETIAQQL
jgi:hypothetical protein